MSVDGFGDFASAAWGLGRRHRLAVDGTRLLPALARRLLPGASPSILGFPHYGDEYKVMGLAPYGQPTYLDQYAEDRGAARPDGTLPAQSRTTSGITGRAAAYEWDERRARVRQPL